MNNQKNVIINKVCHCRTSLSGIYNALKNTRWGSPTKTLGDDANEYTGMTPLFFKEEALNKNAFRAPLRSGFTLRPSSSRSVSMRDIGAAPRGFTARSVTPQCRYAGYSGRRGFTLIELLVVVLIIGILAAVAVPQYQKAVEKSRLTEAIVTMDTIKKNADLYVLERGMDGNWNYPENWTTDLSGGTWNDRPIVYTTKNFVYDVDDNGGVAAYRCAGTCTGDYDTDYDGMIYELYQGYPFVAMANGLDPDKICTGYTSLGKSICQSLTAQGWQDQSNYNN